MMEEHLNDSGELRGPGFMLRLQSGRWITLMVMREHAKEGEQGEQRASPQASP